MPGSNLKMKSVSEPKSLRNAFTSLYTPIKTATTDSSAVIPITTPSTVKNDRILFSFSVVSAIRAFSPRAIRILLLSTAEPALNLHPQRFDRLQHRRLPRRIHAKENPHGRRDQLRDDNRCYRHMHGNRRRRQRQPANRIRQKDA